jgi:hypothetical protein
MSLLDDIAKSIGHTVESLASSVGIDTWTLESVVNDLDGNNINVFSMASRLGFSVEGFLSSIVDLMRGDPHQQLLSYLTAPVKRMDSSLFQLSLHWSQVASLHQDTAQAIDAHMKALFHGSGDYSYSGQAADSLFETHQEYQQHFNELIDHAQTQHNRHRTLQDVTSSYLGQMPGKVYSLSTPVAAFGVLAFRSASAFASAPPPGQLIDPNWIKQAEEIAQQAWNDSEDVPPGPEDPVWDIEVIVAIAVWIAVGVMLLVNWLAEAIANFIYQQQNTPPPKSKPKAGSTIGHPQPKSPSHSTDPNSPTPVVEELTPAQKRLLQDVKSRLGGVSYDDAQIEALIRAGYLDPDTIAAIIKGGAAGVFNDANIAAKMNTLTGARQLYLVGLIVDKKYVGDPKDALNAILDTADLPSSEGMTTLADNKKYTSTAHTLGEHVAVDPSVLIERTSKKNKDGGADRATSFSDPVTAQNAVDMVIAKSPKLQAFIKAAVPNTNMQDTQCGDENDDFGYGYKRNQISDRPPAPVYGPPTPYKSLHCATAWMGIDANGKPFVIDAYPAIPAIPTVPKP